MYPILLDLGVWQLRSYGVVVAIALLVGIWWSAREAERPGFARPLVHDVAWTVVLAGLVGARFYYVMFLVLAAAASVLLLRRTVWRANQPAVG